MEQRFHEIREHSSWVFKAKLSYCEIWEHSMTHTIAEAYPVDNYEKTHARFNRNTPHLVNSFGAIVDYLNNKTLLLIERIPSRLSQVSALNQSQTLKVLYSVFRGLQQLEENYGYIYLTQSCICFNETGKVKIWVNPDLSSLHSVGFIKQKGNNKIVQILNQILKMVEKKSFNTSFLRVFDRKLKENKISTFRQAEDEILKIGELLFIDIEQKTINTAYVRKNSRSKSIKNENIPERDHINCNKPTNIENQDYHFYFNERTSRMANHSRKFSNHEGPHQISHRRYQSFLQNEYNNKKSQIIKSNFMNINVNKENKFFQSQIHRSAPLSPREQILVSNQGTAVTHQFQQSISKKQKDQQLSLQKTVKTQKFLLNNKKQLGANKKQSNKNGMCSTIEQVADDSFSRNLKVDDKQIQITGEFQTFGILDDLNEKHQNKPSVDNSPKFLDFNIQLMDLEIQRKLNIKGKQRKEKRVSMPQPTIGPIQSLLNPSSQNDVVNTTSFFNQKPISKDNIKSTELPWQTKREKLSSMTFIDKKYEQYIEHKNVNQERTKPEFEISNIPPKSARKHSKHMSNCQNISNFNTSKVDQYQTKINSNISYFNHYSATSRNNKFGGFRIPTER